MAEEAAVTTLLVILLLVKVSVVSFATKVSVAVGRVTVPVLLIVAITGVVRVLLVKVCEPVKVTTLVVSTAPAAVKALSRASMTPSAQITSATNSTIAPTAWS